MRCSADTAIAVVVVLVHIWTFGDMISLGFARLELLSLMLIVINEHDEAGEEMRDEADKCHIFHCG